MPKLIHTVLKLQTLTKLTNLISTHFSARGSWILEYPPTSVLTFEHTYSPGRKAARPMPGSCKRVTPVSRIRTIVLVGMADSFKISLV